MKRFVAYYRVSTAGQAKSGLGLEAQYETVHRYVTGIGGSLVGEYQEVESGNRRDREILMAAIRQAKAERATLVIARLDRLARNVTFISQLMDSGVDFVATDMPSASRLTIHIFAAMAEYEREAISVRTKDALKAAKARGVVLGSPRQDALSKQGANKAKEHADDYARRIMPLISALRNNGATTFQRLATALEEAGIQTRRGGRWSPAGVRNIVLRTKSLARAPCVPSH